MTAIKDQQHSLGIHTDGAEVDVVHHRLLLGEEHLHHFEGVGVGRRYALVRISRVSRVCLLWTEAAISLWRESLCFQGRMIVTYCTDGKKIEAREGNDNKSRIHVCKNRDVNQVLKLVVFTRPTDRPTAQGSRNHTKTRNVDPRVEVLTRESRP